MTPVDVQLLIPLSLGALTGLRRGFLLGLFDLLGLAASIWLAGLLFPWVAGWVSAPLGLPDWAVNLSTFASLLILFQLGYGLVVLRWLYPVRRLLTATFFLKWLDIAGGDPARCREGAAPGCAGADRARDLAHLPTRPARLSRPRSSAAFSFPGCAHLNSTPGPSPASSGCPLPAGTTGDQLPLPAAARPTIDPRAEEEILALINTERARYALAPPDPQPPAPRPRPRLRPNALPGGHPQPPRAPTGAPLPSGSNARAFGRSAPARISPLPPPPAWPTRCCSRAPPTGRTCSPPPSAR
ncbi:MAG: hypothetical protein KatS3mg061_0280 [Dehalococcoidia bacterium]|nr:MAG: hypothetical protein KatS3mg061_0280 [Dehalococcoidia bacterium]